MRKLQLKHRSFHQGWERAYGSQRLLNVPQESRRHWLPSTFLQGCFEPLEAAIEGLHGIMQKQSVFVGNHEMKEKDFVLSRVGAEGLLTAYDIALQKSKITNRSLELTLARFFPPRRAKEYTPGASFSINWNRKGMLESFLEFCHCHGHLQRLMRTGRVEVFNAEDKTRVGPFKDCLILQHNVEITESAPSDESATSNAQLKNTLFAFAHGQGS